MFTSKAAPISAEIRLPLHPSQTSENCVAGSYTSIVPARSSAKWDRVYGLCDEAILSPWLDDRAECFRTEGKSTELALGIDFKVRSPLIQSALQCLGDCKEDHCCGFCRDAARDRADCLLLRLFSRTSAINAPERMDISSSFGKVAASL